MKSSAWHRAVVLFVASLPLISTSGCASLRPVYSGKYKLTARRAPQDTVWLDTLDLSAVIQDWGTAQAGRSVDGKRMKLNGVVYRHGVGTHAYSEVTIDLKGCADSFHAAAGVDDESEERGSVVFSVWVDDKLVTESGILRGKDPPEIFSVDLVGARYMTLIVEAGPDNIDNDHADWAGALLVLSPGATDMPETIPLPTIRPPSVTASFSPEPVINAPRITGATPGRPFLFRIPATGEAPLLFSAEGLPPGLLLDAPAGIIRGSLLEEGSWKVDLRVHNARGHAQAHLQIVGRPHSLALTPPMGWNSWNVWGTSVDDAKVRQAADWMVASGLAAHGYQYVNIDDSWEGERDAAGHMRSNEKFPDMKALADYVHSKGLKLGIYSSPGPRTCAGYEGSYQHEFQDAETFAEWGIDLIKYDWCSYENLAKDHSTEELRKPYELMRAALDQCSRDIVFSICQYGMGDVSEWGAAVGGNLWRTTGDITDTWTSMSSIGFGQDGLEQFAGPGQWNDPDMLVVGRLGWGPELHATDLTPHEQLTHVTLWSLLAAPLLIGCDLSQLDEFTLALLTNPEILEVNQDPLGEQAHRCAQTGRAEVWVRELVDGSLALGLFNRRPRPVAIEVQWADLGLSYPQRVRDLWLREDLGTFAQQFGTVVQPHGAALLKITPVTEP